MFSNDARWDRHLPYQSRDNDVIEVGAVFKHGQIHPKTFIWKSKKYMVKEVTYRWVDKRGGEQLHYFSVTDGINVYLIYLNSKHMHWRLEKIMDSHEYK